MLSLTYGKRPLKHLRNHRTNGHGAWYTASGTRGSIIDCLNDDPKEKKIMLYIVENFWSVGRNVCVCVCVYFGACISASLWLISMRLY